MRLVESCAAKTGSCLTLRAGDLLRPVPWSGFSCSSQCNLNCDKNFHYSKARFRFVVKSCDGAQRFEGAVFELPAVPPK